MKTPNCIKVRMHTENGWRDVPCELNSDGDAYFSLDDPDGVVDRSAIVAENVVGDLIPYDKYSVEDEEVGTLFEITWSGDKWP